MVTGIPLIVVQSVEENTGWLWLQKIQVAGSCLQYTNHVFHKPFLVFQSNLHLEHLRKFYFHIDLIKDTASTVIRWLCTNFAVHLYFHSLRDCLFKKLFDL